MLHRASNHLISISKRYPDAWKHIDMMRNDMGVDLPRWEPWCYAPFGAWYAIVSAQHRTSRLHTQEQIADIAILAALGTWRVTQGIYRFDPALYDAIVETSITGDLPCDVLFRLPEWCVYIETPGLKWIDRACAGMWVHLEDDAQAKTQELRLVFDCVDGLGSVPLHLGDWSLEIALQKMSDTSRKNAQDYAQQTGISIDYNHDSQLEVMRKCLEPFLSLILYLCSQNAEIGDGQRQPTFPQPRKTKQGLRMFAPDKPTTWDVGLRIGAALRRAYHDEQTHQGGTHNAPRPHIRRAHWHSFWSGARKDEDKRKKQLKWLPPIAVNADLGEIVPTVRKVD